MNKLAVTLRPVADLVPYARNARTHSESQIDALCLSLKEFGWTNPVLVDGSNGIIAGHGRVLAAKKLGMAQVPCIELAHLTPDQRRAYVIADNQTALRGGWDNDLLKLELDALDAAGFDLAPLGFEVAEPAAVRDTRTVGATDPDEAPAAPVNPVSATGDLWCLGRHRVLCGDATSAEDVLRLLDGALADLCFTSPPYAQQRDYGKPVADWDGLMQGAFSSAPMTPAGQILVNIGLIHRDGEWVPYWDSWVEWMRAQGWRRFGWYVWDKLAGLPGDWQGRLAPSHEWLFHFNRAASKPQKTKEKKPDSIEYNSHGSGLRAKNGKMSGVSNCAASLQTHKIPDSVFRLVPHKARGGANEHHPAMFPVALPQEVITAFSRPGDAVYDPFLGSGTTLIAAEMTGRTCYGIEIAPAYIDVIIQRFESFTGEKATLDGRTYAEVQDARFSPAKDMAASVEYAYENIRERVAAGGPGWP